ncbi:hypothetical protein ALI144C_04725 [Actinosynnema sp. ALI-1.44]|uniref:VC0807 family protein n=1 Tax=Actinosynnema sp. ALI-1.44 TaxID=1933779 RepID=UPI00097BCD4E|nr:VC0807 family protein [Actinosynnema sp. ALI-1.44]ONI89644.1 hypothetical protein ALI144C_04725 [Actinosynnema sp. ALI-1.44]
MAEAAAEASRFGSLLDSLRPLLLDVGVPLILFYGLHSGFGVDDLWSLAAGGIFCALRVLWSWVRARSLESLALLVLIVSVVGIALSFVSGSARFLIAKDSLGTGIVGLVAFFSVFSSKPMMTQGLKPFYTRGKPERVAAWDRLSAAGRLLRLERRCAAIWGGLLVLEAVARIILAFIIPVDTMVWLSTVILITALSWAGILTGILTQSAEALINEDVASRARPGTDSTPTAAQSQAAL